MIAPATQGDRGTRGGFGLPGIKGVKGMKGGKGEKGMMGDEGLNGTRGRVGKCSCVSGLCCIATVKIHCLRTQDMPKLFVVHHKQTVMYLDNLASQNFKDCVVAVFR